MYNFILGIIGLLFLYLWMIAPGKRRLEQHKLFSSWNYAHRGFHDNEQGIPENSLAAFAAAVDLGYGIELDVQMTKDKRLVVFHDDSLKRVCGIDQQIKHLEYKELLELRLFNTKELIPLLSEVLEVVSGRVPLLIEVKLNSTDTTICHYIDLLLRGYQGLYCIESFNPLVIFWYRCKRKCVFRGQLSGNLLKEADNSLFTRIAVTNLLVNFLGRPNFIAYQYTDIQNLSYQVVKKFFKITTFAWTIKNYEAYLSCNDSFDGVIFEGFDINKERNLKE